MPYTGEVRTARGEQDNIEEPLLPIINMPTKP